MASQKVWWFGFFFVPLLHKPFILLVVFFFFSSLGLCFTSFVCISMCIFIWNLVVCFPLHSVLFCSVLFSSVVVVNFGPFYFCNLDTFAIFGCCCFICCCCVRVWPLTGIYSNTMPNRMSPYHFFHLSFYRSAGGRRQAASGNHRHLFN